MAETPMTHSGLQRNAVGQPSKPSGISTISENSRAVDTALERLTLSLPSLLECEETREKVSGFLPKLQAPADGAWLMARVAALLNPYYEKDVPQGVRVMEAEDWAFALEGFPQWAVEKAVRWWKGTDNTKRHKRPLEGDIVARCKVEMQAVNAAATYLNMPVGSGYKPAPKEPRATKDKTAEILRKAGYRVNKFGGVE